MEKDKEQNSDENVLDVTAQKPQTKDDSSTSDEIIEASNSHDTHEKVEFDDSKESKKMISDDNDLKQSVATREIKGVSAQDESILSTPLVAHPLSGKPVYATAAQAQLADSLKDKK